jgi:hypothetical protein
MVMDGGDDGDASNTMTRTMMTTMTTMTTMGIDEGGWEGVLKINAFLPFSSVCVGRGGRRGGRGVNFDLAQLASQGDSVNT